MGGIRAKKIEAENIVDGVQAPAGTAEQAAGLVALARAIRSGGIDAEELRAKNVVVGLQVISEPAKANAGDLRQEAAALRKRLESAAAAGEIAPAEARDAAEALGKVVEELAGGQPQGSRVVRKLAEVSQILTAAAEAAQAAGKFGWQVLQLAPLAAMLWQIARGMFGG